MGSLQEVTERVLAHVPPDRHELATSALAAMSDLCRWVDHGGTALDPRVDMFALLASLRSVLGTREDFFLCRKIDRDDPGGPDFSVHHTDMVADRLRDVPTTHPGVDDDVMDAIPWCIDAVLWKHLPGRVDASVPTALHGATAVERRAIVTVMKAATHAYILAVLAADIRAIAILKPVVAAMPHYTLVDVMETAPNEPRAAFILF